MTDKGTYQRLEKDVTAVKNDIADLASEDTLEDVIVQRPLATVGLALGLGVLIGVTWRR